MNFTLSDRFLLLFHFLVFGLGFFLLIFYITASSGLYLVFFLTDSLGYVLRNTKRI